MILGAIIALASVALMAWTWNELNATCEPFLFLLGVVFVATFVTGILISIEDTPIEDFLSDMFSGKEANDE